VGGDGFLVELALVAVLILLNGFFAGAEIAVISARMSRIRPLAERGNRRAASLLRLKANPDRFLATVQIGVTVVGTLASAVGGVAAIERLEPLFASVPVPWVRQAAEPLAVGCVVFVIAYASLVVGELTPKSLAVRHAETLALLVARPIEWLSRISRAAVTVLTSSTGILLRLVGQRAEHESPFHTLEDLRAVVREAERQGLVAGALVRGAFEIHDCEVRDIMTPRTRVVGIARGARLEEAVRVAKESDLSRFPVYEGSLDNVQGMVHARDVYEAALRDDATGIGGLVRPTLVVPETKKASDLLAEMRRARIHMTMVVDEHGSMVGLATLEDLFEIIVGDIEDEHEAPTERVRVLGEGLVDADASLSVRELNTEYDLVLPESDGYVTIAGLILDRLGTIPRGGEQVEASPYRLTVVGVDGRRITRARIEKVTSADAPAE
jgi:putative hemolysin